MATFRIPHLAAPHVLPTIARDGLLRFLEPHRASRRRIGWTSS